MYVQCPQCDAVFRVSTRMLTQAEGMVRCGECEHVFNAMDTLLAVPPEPPPAPPEQIALDEDTRDDEDTLPRDVPSIIAEDLHATRRRRTGGGGARLAWGLASLLLIAGLAAQYVWYELDTLYRYPSLQSGLERFCELAGCELPQRRDVSRIELVSRHVYSHPNIEGALVITSTVVNNAPFPQPYPVLGIRFSDLQGQPVAERRFLPHEYLGAPVPADRKMEPGNPVTINLEVVDPGDKALSFQFDFF